jgi:hypothetical protein
MNRDLVAEKIEREFATAKKAQEIGNRGMVRVCARRAAGMAVAFWLQSHPRRGWGTDAMSRLRGLQRDDSIPQHVKDAASRLTARITSDFTHSFTTDPLQDSRLIIEHMLDVTRDRV